MPKVLAIMKSFYEMTGIQSSVTDVEGNLVFVEDEVLLGVGWQKVCLNFHRKNPSTHERCLESDTILSKELSKGKRYARYKCQNGLIDIAIPIYIDGEHVVNLFTGQFFVKQPDFKFFKKQATEFGFDEKSYLEAIKEVPVISEERIELAVSFLTNFAELIIKMGMDNKRLKELAGKLENKVDVRTENLKRAIKEIKKLGELLPICANCKKIRNDNGYWDEVEAFIAERADVKFSHSICPECKEILYPNYANKNKSKKQS